MIIDGTGVQPGEYTLYLESYDELSAFPFLNLKTDIVTIVVTKAASGFVEELKTKILTAGVSESWQLPFI